MLTHPESSFAASDVVSYSTCLTQSIGPNGNLWRQC